MNKKKSDNDKSKFIKRTWITVCDESFITGILSYGLINSHK